jgi:hypothetical protein
MKQANKVFFEKIPERLRKKTSLGRNSLFFGIYNTEEFFFTYLQLNKGGQSAPPP